MQNRCDQIQPWRKTNYDWTTGPRDEEKIYDKSISYCSMAVGRIEIRIGYLPPLKIDRPKVMGFESPLSHRLAAGEVGLARRWSSRQVTADID